MNLFKFLLIVLIFLINLLFAQPSYADKPKITKDPDYIEVTKALSTLQKTKDSQGQIENYTPEEVQKKIDELEFQKYTLEAGLNWGQCQNETRKTLAIYGPKPDSDDYSYENALYFLADGQTTKKNWDCDGVYLPNDVKATTIGLDRQSQELRGPLAIRIADGTKLIVKSSPDNSTVEFNVPPTQVLKPGGTSWFVPNVSQAAIDSRVVNAPAVKIASASLLAVRRNPEPSVDEFHVSPESKPQLQSQPKSQLQPQSQGLPRRGFYNRY
ncbi:MAG: hypothetical protein JOZ78_25760 [Chroococcidiopsidaceae cyanobacterium CP_BM_ER_R8_30]|nr:hypothetical protein [Chroococcidiopsidaceae cyanobacterium CP_BM_ER_R8_30]